MKQQVESLGQLDNPHLVTINKRDVMEFTGVSWDLRLNLRLSKVVSWNIIH